MHRIMLKSKIHRATVTGADLDYEGSVTIDSTLMDMADIVPYEQVQIYNISNGHRLETYAIDGEPGGGEICINGAAAHLVGKGDTVIIASYVWLSNEAAKVHSPKLIYVDANNGPKEKAVRPGW